MRIFYSFSLLLLTLGATAQSFNYTGNGGTGFGGPIGGSTLTVSSDATNVSFSLTTGTAFSGNALVIYVDSKSGGVTNTSSFTDQQDGGRTAISGLGNSGRTVVNFPAGFGADYAITVEPGVFSALFDLSTPANFTYVGSGNLAGSGSGPFTFSFPRASLGITGTGTAFSFVGTLISTSAYRSNETIGTSTTTPGTAGDAPNAGFTGTQTFSAANSYSFGVLPLRLVRFQGRIAPGGVELNWATATETALRHFEIESSPTGAHWTLLTTVAARNEAAAAYSQLVSAPAGHRLYRLRMVEANGRQSHSSVLDIAAKGRAVKLLANPVRDGAVRLGVNGDAADYAVAMNTLDGRQVRRSVYRHPGGAGTVTVDAAGLPKSTYVVTLTAGTEVQSFRVVVQ